jgi:acetyl esterase/lipase
MWLYDDLMRVPLLTALMFFQVVPPDQARKIYNALKERGLPVALVEYEGEQHGFRKVVTSLPYYVLVLHTFKEIQLAFTDFIILSILNRLRTSSSPWSSRWCSLQD